MSIPEEIQPETQADAPESTESQAVDWEKRFKDTQAAFTKSQQKLKAYEAENRALSEKLNEAVSSSLALDAETKERLEDLKIEDPDAWRSEMNKLEIEQKAKHAEAISELTGDAKKAAEREFELEQRAQVLEDFKASHSDFEITDEIIANDVPPRITKKLETGSISFGEFLEEVYTYLNKPKKVENPDVSSQPNMNETGGSSAPSKKSVEADLASTYKQIMY